jgi:transcription-repair coupling factor (superfamily II helicase)
LIVQDIKNVFCSSPPFQELYGAVEEGRNISVAGVSGSARSIVLGLLFEKLPGSILCVLPSEEEAIQLYEDLATLLGEQSVILFPSHGTQAWSEVGPLSSAIGSRITALKSLQNREKCIFVASAQALMEKVACSQDLRKSWIRLSAGQPHDFEPLIERLVRIGYSREERVDRPGEMSVRGGLIDIFLYEELNPFRIEFYGDQIESIREFDVESQRSLKKHEKLDILPISAAGAYTRYDDQPIDTLPFNAVLLEYFAGDMLVSFFDQDLACKAMEDYEKEMSVRIETFAEEHGFDHQLKYEDYYSNEQFLDKKLQEFNQIQFLSLSYQASSPIDFDIRHCAQYAGNLSLFRGELLQQFSDFNAGSKVPRMVVLSDSEAQTNRLKDLFVQEGFPAGIEVETSNLSEGFIWPEEGLAVYTNKNLYGRLRLPKFGKMATRKVSFKDLSSFRNGDYVVHADFGIGIFRGLKRIKAYDKERECLIIEYRDGDKVYVPLEKMDRVQKYSSRESVVPALSKLGSADWDRLKKRTKQRVKEIAAQLIKLYATRKLKPGYAFSADTIWQKELEASFSYEETIDQLNAVNEIKADMENPIPMERLVCGDVGYGKTEVAIRAAFKALNDGKQVCVLVPTTVLAQQHLSTFSERLKPFPVKIEMLSRFKSAAQQKEIVERLEKGKVDLIIGTHRLLSQDVKFSDLGLLIIDEEQKFGVMHKERLKVLKHTVDTLMLSATPIPRTMHLALIGARDMSIINTPPSNRLPVHTEVSRFSKEHIREAILNEVQRGGQVFFIHNRVQSIHAIFGLLRELVPEVSFGVAHGQMKASDLEKVMMAFTMGEIQCLICTMIIESGIDMPNANTLIVNRADRFGLSQLYQLRGRVGRSNQQAFAHLLIPPLRKLSRTAIKRLQTIQEHSDLGSGYKIAVRDLEIRGAGNVFGAEQSGFVDALGFELYAKIIEEAIGELRSDLKIEPALKKEESEPDAKIDVKVDAYLPPEYVSSAAERVDIYKRLIEAQIPKEVNDLQAELIDRFGSLPQAAKNLVDYILIKILSRQAKIEEIALRNSRILTKFKKASIPKGEQFRMWLGRIVEKVHGSIEFKQEGDTIILELKVSQEANYLDVTKSFLQSLAE